MLRGIVSKSLLGGVIISVCSLAFLVSANNADARGRAPRYMGMAGCKCHLSKGCFEGEVYKETLHANTWDERLKGTEDEDNPECLKCHATALGEKIRRRYKNKDYLPNVQGEACHGAGEEYVKLKKNYKGEGKDAFKKLLKKDPLMARKVQYDAGLRVAGINDPETVKEQCMECHWESKDAEEKCPKTDKVMDYKEYFKEDDHRDEDAIDKVIDKLSSSEKKKWADILPKDDMLYLPLKKKAH